MRYPLAIAIAAAAALSACGSNDQATANADAAAAAQVGNDQADMTPESAGIFEKLLNNGQPMRLASETLHPNGGVLKLNSIQVKPTETVVNITYVNGHTQDVQLNWLGRSKKTYLLVNNRKFILSPPVTDENVLVAAGATVTGDFVFVGAVPSTSQLQLVINESGGNYDSAYNPKFVVDIPVTSAAYSDDGSKKKSVV